MHEENITYVIEKKEFIGKLVAPIGTGPQKRPAVLIAHAWMGRDNFAVQKAHKIAMHLGYIGFAADLYGDAQVVQTPAEATVLMLPLFLDRALLQKRIQAALNALRQHPLVDTNRIAAIGFCFGGLAVIELLRSGADVKGVVSFHGLYGNQMGNKKAQTVPIAKDIQSALLLLHGYDDPLSSTEDVLHIQKEMNEANVNWQMNIYGHTSHAFTNPKAHDVEKGLIYNPKISARAWQAMTNFFEEVLS
jgi:dienelactone hydrolase